MVEKIKVDDTIYRMIYPDQGGCVTKVVRQVLKKAESMTLMFEVDPDAPDYQSDQKKVTLIFHVRGRFHDTTVLEYHEFPGFMGNIASGRGDRTEYRDMGYLDYERGIQNCYAPESGKWYVNVMLHARNVLRCYQTKEPVKFVVRLDWHTSPSLSGVGVHVDVLQVSRLQGDLCFDLAIEARQSPRRFGYDAPTDARVRRLQEEEREAG